MMFEDKLSATESDVTLLHIITNSYCTVIL